jgi:hypothetical protein
MTVLTICRDEYAASVASGVDDGFDDIIWPQTTPPMIAEVRIDKIIEIRQQLIHGTYDLDERLDAILERILTDITP